MINHIDIARCSIENFSFEHEDYLALQSSANIHGNGEVFARSREVKARIKINFGNTTGCKVFLGKNLHGSISIRFQGNNSIIYIGNGCMLNNLEIRSSQENDFVAVGNGVTTTEKNVWVSGKGSGSATPSIIIGDDCMFSYDIVMRNTDAHPIFNSKTNIQVNEPKSILHIEPHVWIGEKVNITKSLEIGACSIIALGAIVTKDVPRFSIARGVPAESHQTNNYWSRSHAPYAINRAKYWFEKYKN